MRRHSAPAGLCESLALAPGGLATLGCRHCRHALVVADGCSAKKQEKQRQTVKCAQNARAVWLAAVRLTNYANLAYKHKTSQPESQSIFQHYSSRRLRQALEWWQIQI